jgi:hypothetical protein
MDPGGVKLRHGTFERSEECEFGAPEDHPFRSARNETPNNVDVINTRTGPHVAPAELLVDNSIEHLYVRTVRHYGLYSMGGEPVDVEALSQGEARSCQCDDRAPMRPDPLRCGIDQVEERHRYRALDRVRTPMHGVTGKQDEGSTSPLCCNGGVGNDPSLRVPIALLAERPDLAAIN